jgi:hypothetical protein
MTNVTGRKRSFTVNEVSVPNPATRRDLCDLLTFADRKFEEVSGRRAEFDDEYMITADEDQITATIKEEVQ